MSHELGTTTSGSAISEMVRVINGATGWDREEYAGNYVVLDISAGDEQVTASVR